MRKSFKCLVGILAGIILCATAFTGCSGNDSGGKENSSGIVSNTETKVHKISIMGPESAPLPYKFENRDKFEVWKQIEAMFSEENIMLSFEPVSQEQYPVVSQTRLASGSKLPDIVMLGLMDEIAALDLAKQKVIVPLNDSIKQYSNGNIMKMYTEDFPSAFPLTLDTEGEMYWFSNLHRLTYKDTHLAPYQLTINYRKDWADKLGIKEPTTKEEFKDMMMRFRTEDANKNGQSDEIMKLPIDDFQNAIAQWFGLGSGITSFDPALKKMVTPWYQPNIKEYFQYMNSLVNEKVIDASVVGNNEMSNQRMAENKVGASYDYAASVWLEERVTSVKDSMFQPLLPLKAVDGTKPAMHVESPELVWSRWAVTKSCEDIEGIIKMFDLICTEKYATLSMWGIEGQTFNVVDGHKEIIPNLSQEKKAEELFYASGKDLTDGLLPRIQFTNLEVDILNTNSESKKEFLRNMINYDTWFPLNNTNFQALPTDDEIKVSQKHLTNLQTYSSELATKLILGQASLDDWDKYMSELKKLGLDELLASNQARYDRFAKNIK